MWFLARGLEDGRTRWLMLSGVSVGLGFEAKMAAALLVVPAIVAAWLWIAPRGRWAAVRQLAAGGVAMTVVGVAWPMLMWLTPAGDRPWVSGTSDNSIWSLILGYNGFGRLLGQNGGPGGGAGGPGGPGGGGPGGLFGGDPGALRLLNQALGGQGGWLLGFAVVAGVLLVALTRVRRADARTGWLVAVGGTFAVTAVAFSKAQGIFHPYYVSLLAPFTAALFGAGAGELAKGGRLARIGGPLAIAGGAVTELVVLHDNPGELGWVRALILVVGGAAAVVLATGLPVRARAIAVATALGVLVLAPGAWAFQTLGHAANGTFPAGGPASAGMGGFGRRSGPPAGFMPGASGGGAGNAPRGFAPGAGAPPAGPPPGVAGSTAPPFGSAAGGGPFGGDSQSLTAAVRYVKAHGGGTIAVSSQTGAAGTIITSDADVAGIGGFSGRESQVSLSWLADAVEAGRIRWVVTDGSAGFMPRDGRIGATDVMSAARKAGTRVSSVSGLYDLRGKAAALRALA